MTRTIHASDFNKMPVWFKVLNRTWKFTYPIGTRIRINKDDLIKAARKNTGLKDLGSEFWDEPLERLIKSINEEAELHPIGLFISRERLINLLATRLKAEWWFKIEPGILDQALYPVMLIAGLQRTGTTKLQRLLSSDPDTRSLLSWEALNPAPPVKGKDNRIGFAKTSEKALRYMAPGFFALHPVEHEAQEEDILLLDVSFLSTTPEATMYVPSYANWLERTDQTLAYSYAVKLLKLLQWQRPANRWVLKSPHHLEFLDIIDKQFEKVHFLWTHRDLKTCIPSFLSMAAHSQSIFTDQVAIEHVTDHWLKKTKYMLDKAISFRKTSQEKDKFIDIHYNTFIERPLPTIQSVYKKVGIKMEKVLIDKMVSFEKKNTKGKYGIHRYNLGDFGITDELIHSHFEEYLDFLKKIKG